METEHSDNKLIRVNQRDIKTMLEERILNPRKYADRPLLIWRSYFNDDIQKQVFFDFESRIKELMHKQQQHFRYPNDDDQFNIGNDMAIPRWITLKLDDFRDNALFMLDKGLNRVFCLFFDLTKKNVLKPPHYKEFYKEYSDIINSDWLIRVKEYLNAPIVVYLPFIEQPEAFKGYDQYVFTPDFEEWEKELSEYQNPLIEHLIGFLESYTNEEERNYRWNWYFKRIEDSEGSSNLKSYFKRTGCDFPFCWLDGIKELSVQFIIPRAQKPKIIPPKPKPTKISEIPMDEFKDIFNMGISEDVIEDFRNYLIVHNVEIQRYIDAYYLHNQEEY